MSDVIPTRDELRTAIDTLDREDFAAWASAYPEREAFLRCMLERAALLDPAAVLAAIAAAHDATRRQS